ncbi:MAG: hydroxymethylglutaryl-CoA lyase [Gammaproteobacteria bacterium]|nr:hydroxymethylglutaryl-CoA lyase [Gammaproteobacteria bacterium]
MSFPHAVKLVEVGPRDGLQNESQIIPTATKIEFINRLSETGLPVIEATSFVSPKWVPQLADASEVLRGIDKKKDVEYTVLVPNLKGLKQAMLAGATSIAVFTSASETFSQKNTNCTIAVSLERIAAIIAHAKQHQLIIRGYISCVLGCPYEGKINVAQVVTLTHALFQMGCSEISLGDTIGVGTPFKTKSMLEQVFQKVPVESIGVHFHDTYGQALANIYAALQEGVTTIDSSIAGLGGCPYAQGASGNVATEDILYMLDGMGIETGVNMEKLLNVSRYISQVLKRPPASKVGLALAL